MDLLVIAESIPICNTLPLKNRQVVGKAIALPYIGRHCLPNDKSQFIIIFYHIMGKNRLHSIIDEGKNIYYNMYIL